MRPLKRPMFRNGGPIKEGIMDGMKEPQAINTVGSPLAPQDSSGRQGYAIPLLGFLGANALRTAALRAAPRIANFFRTQVGTKGPGTVRVPGAPGTPGRFTTAGSKVIDKQGPGMPIYTPTKLATYLQSDPLIATGSKVVQGLASPTSQGLIQKGARIVLSPTGIATGLFYAGGKFFDQDGNEQPPPNEEVVLGDRVGTSGAPGGGDPDMFLEPRKKTQEEKDKITADRIEENRKRYYKLMGIDKMQKGAAYDSLIDASKIIQEEGGDLKGSIKSGNLQTRIIDAISKNLDKSANIKKQIDAAILKGEIEKDIKSSDPTVQKKSDLMDRQIAIADKSLAGGSLIENIDIGRKAAGGANSTTNVYNSVIKSLGVEPTVLKDTAETIKLRKTDDYTTDAALVKKIVEAENRGPGVYIIDKSVILVDENGNTRTLALG